MSGSWMYRGSSAVIFLCWLLINNQRHALTLGTPGDPLLTACSSAACNKSARMPSSSLSTAKYCGDKAES